jgi:hypothetical protein
MPQAGSGRAEGASMGDDLKWYDSGWLDKYLAAKEVIARMAPSRLQEFVDSFHALRTDPSFCVKDLPGVFSAEMLATIKSIVRSIPMTAMEMHEIKRFGRMVVHNHHPFTEMQRELVDKISDLVGETVEPSYNFLSLYTRMGICEPHLDAPSAKWTLDICIDQSEPWPIHFSQIIPWPEQRVGLGDDWQAAIKTAPNLEFQSKVLTPGNGIVFSGSSQWHYRDALPQVSSNCFCDLLFFHYIPKGAAEIVETQNWARLFNIPELASIPGIDNRT